jgi:hypothetical protein
MTAEKSCEQWSAGVFHQQYFEGGISDRLLSAHQTALVIAVVNGLEALLKYIP